MVADEEENGFAQPALRASDAALPRRRQQTGDALRSRSQFAPLRRAGPTSRRLRRRVHRASDGERRQRMVVMGGKRKLLGTSQMAFACPRPGKLADWSEDQASSVMAQGELLALADNVANAAWRGCFFFFFFFFFFRLDRDGQPILPIRRGDRRRGSILPFRRHKGSSMR